MGKLTHSWYVIFFVLSLVTLDCWPPLSRCSFSMYSSTSVFFCCRDIEGTNQHELAQARTISDLNSSSLVHELSFGTLEKSGAEG